jgi:hypothetical protein
MKKESSLLRSAVRLLAQNGFGNHIQRLDAVKNRVQDYAGKQI